MMSAQSFSIGIEHYDMSWKVSCEGELDAATFDRVEDALDLCLSTSPVSIFLDCREVSFIDSAGIWALLRCGNRCREAGVEFELSVSEQVRAVLGRVGLAERLLLGPSTLIGPQA